MTLYLLQYNNYSNRTIKGYASINQYSDYIVGSYTDINFGPNDGVSTSIVLNTSEVADYLIAVYETMDAPTAADVGTIANRWFIMSNQRTRQGQYRYELRRDLVYDYLEQVVHSTAYITKGWVNLNDSAIYNQEQLPVNQIKKGEILLQDITRTPWIVGYLGKTTEAKTISRKNIYPDATVVTEAVFDKLNSRLPMPDRIAYDLFDYHLQSSGIARYARYYVVNFNKTGRLPLTTSYGDPNASWSVKQGSDYFADENDMLALADDLSELDLTDAIEAEVMDEWTYTYSDYEQYRDKIISYNGKYYKCTFSSGIVSTNKTLAETSLTRISLYNALRSNALVINKPQLVSNVPVEIDYRIVMYTPKLEEIVDEYTATIPATANRVNLNNQPYSMFAMPYYDYSVKGTGIDMTTQGRASLSIAQAIAENLSGDRELYDLQIVPYCPILQYVDSYELTSHVWLDDMPTGSYTPITHTSGGTTETVGYIFWCADDSFTFDIPVSYDLPTDPIEFKVDIQSLLWRLCSPNYSGAFDFNPAKNNGVTKINVDCTYKPYSPYIHLNPDFGGLYGQDYNDARGLICGGEFSLPQTTDQWATYQNQNKNYANSFDREIQSIELQNKYARQSDIIGAIAGAGTGAFAGSAIGSMVGGPVGNAIGGIAGGIFSAGAGITDIAINNKLREEQLSLKKDLWNYSLENIQALPNTLTKVGSLNANNKLFPFIEIYDCTDEEKEAIRNKIIYNGMTINRIGQILDFTDEDRFLQCTLIRTDIHDEWNVIRNIKDELEMGVYL